ncbi:uncharacterized protein J4E92_007795 [Alternaria infectoria]|uniref:uncharacterized protein n=1 Tax=Alternaria infectoria TaxID=45303 RepID=UPI0022201EC3|nr:uncharacterized protein J4E92_007795 [Alternaria infectoria]KAI4923044.1 hypothetical protein J4E92_007795 [Alternaria infectoria]
MSSTAPASQIHLRTPPEPGKKPASRTYLIYFVTGNPGLVEYYRTFLTHLYGLLTHNTASDLSIEFQVYGRSLSGFEMNDAEIKTMKWRKQPPYGLQDQIRHSEDELAELVEEVKESGGARDVRASPFLKNSNFATFAALFVNFLTMFLPISILTTLIAKFMDFPTDAAQTTAAFVKSPHGIHEALHMARDEMFQIDTDIWDEEIWGAAASEPATKHPHPRPILRFLFARKDHWVADATRDALIHTRGRFSRGDGVEEVEGQGENWKPVMEIDEREGWPHGFCIRHGVPVAEKVAGYVRAIVAQDMARK